jgi:hypothetical protein
MKFYQKVTDAENYTMKNVFLLHFSKSLNTPATACQKLCLLVTILTPHDGITRFNGTVCVYVYCMCCRIMCYRIFISVHV